MEERRKGPRKSRPVIYSGEGWEASQGAGKQEIGRESTAPAQGKSTTSVQGKSTAQGQGKSTAQGQGKSTAPTQGRSTAQGKSRPGNVVDGRFGVQQPVPEADSEKGRKKNPGRLQEKIPGKIPEKRREKTPEKIEEQHSGKTSEKRREKTQERTRGKNPEQYQEKKQEQPQEKKRKRVQEAETRLRVLWVILGVLVALLAAAIVYEIVLGNGTKETGAQRMERNSRQEQTAGAGGTAMLDEEIDIDAILSNI